MRSQQRRSWHGRRFGLEIVLTTCFVSIFVSQFMVSHYDTRLERDLPLWIFFAAFILILIGLVIFAHSTIGSVLWPERLQQHAANIEIWTIQSRLGYIKWLILGSQWWSLWCCSILWDACLTFILVHKLAHRSIFRIVLAGAICNELWRQIWVTMIVLESVMMTRCHLEYHLTIGRIYRFLGRSIIHIAGWNSIWKFLVRIKESWLIVEDGWLVILYVRDVALIPLVEGFCVSVWLHTWVKLLVGATDLG